MRLGRWRQRKQHYWPVCGCRRNEAFPAGSIRDLPSTEKSNNSEPSAPSQVSSGVHFAGLVVHGRLLDKLPSSCLLSRLPHGPAPRCSESRRLRPTTHPVAIGFQLVDRPPGDDPISCVCRLCSVLDRLSISLSETTDCAQDDRQPGCYSSQLSSLETLRTQRTGTEMCRTFRHYSAEVARCLGSDLYTQLN